MLLMIKRSVRSEICHAFHRHVKANNTYKKDYDENRETLYIEYCDVKDNQ